MPTEVVATEVVRVRALVVGGAGFVGSHLVDRLLAAGDHVDVVDDLSTGTLANLAAARASGGTLRIDHLDAATTEFDSLVAMRRPEVIYHLAAVPASGFEPVAADSCIAAFGRALAVVEAARVHGVSKVVVAVPAVSVYGAPAVRDLPLKERPLEPRGTVGIVARAIVDLLSQARERDAVEFTVLAVADVYGPRQRPDGGIVAAMRSAASAGSGCAVPGDGRQTRDLVFVDDVVDALARAGQRGSGLVVNIGTGVQTPLRELWAAVSGSPPSTLRSSGSAPDSVQRFALSPVRARIHLGWSPWTSLADGLAQTP